MVRFTFLSVYLFDVTVVVCAAIGAVFTAAAGSTFYTWLLDLYLCFLAGHQYSHFFVAGQLPEGLNTQIAELLEGPVRSILNRIHIVY